MGRLEQLDQIAVGVGEQNLPPTRAGDQVAAEGQVCIAEPGDLGVEVVDDEVDAVTAGGLRRRSRVLTAAVAEVIRPR